MNPTPQIEAFMSEQADILRHLAQAVIEATPEEWSEAQLLVEMTDEGCAHTITSEAHPEDIVAATDEIFALTLRLEDLFRKAGTPWNEVVFKVLREERNEKTVWRFNTSYTYPSVVR